jgi:hypothetical protein
MDLSHAGRLGNTVTVNGREVEEWRLSAGERVRLRLVNACSARILALEFKDHRPALIALDGQAVEPRALAADETGRARLVLSPGERADIVLDAAGKPGQRSSVVDSFYRNNEYRLLDLVYASKPLRELEFGPPPGLTLPRLAGAVLRHDPTFDPARSVASRGLPAVGLGHSAVVRARRAAAPGARADRQGRRSAPGGREQPGHAGVGL